MERQTNQIVGNAGLYYVCYRLSCLGWNVMPTSRNARGVDIVSYNHNASRKITVQVKSLSYRNPVPLGAKLDHLFADYVVICRNALDPGKSPECFIMKPKEVKRLAELHGKGYWLQPRKYEKAMFREKWKRIRSAND